MRLRVTEGPDSGVAKEFHQARVLIGRSHTADLCLNDRTVSACHVELSLAQDKLRIVDLGSRNGVLVGSTVLQRGLLAPGFTMRLGSTSILVEPCAGVQLPRLALDSYEGIVGGAQSMQEMYALLDRLSQTELSVLIQGETGSGKELAARALYRRSRRMNAPFVVLDCAALTATLAQSTLFGHEKGAFTGATERRPGVFEAAHRGVLYIDEVAELPLDLQPLLLRALAERTITPVGSTQAKPVDVRIISASWQDLRRLVNQGKFREDLYYRLAQATLFVPALDERRSDIPRLVRAILAQLHARGGMHAATEIQPEVLLALETRRYPGNVRELRSLIERMAQLCATDTITLDDLAFEQMLAAVRSPSLAPAITESVGPPSAEALRNASQPADSSSEPLQLYKDAKRQAVANFERSYLERLLSRCGNNLSRAASLAGLARQNLRDLLRKHALYAPQD